MKRIILTIILAVAGLAGYSCVEDNGNYTYETLPKFCVDTVGMSSQLTISMLQYEQLNITPNLVFDGDKSKLQHSWSIYSSSFSQTAGVDLVAVPIPGHENATILSMEMTYSPGSYYIEYAAYDPGSERKALMRWHVTVEGTLGSGWLVYYGKNGVADCDLIKTKLLAGSLNEEKVLRGIYSQANPDRPITGEPILCGPFMTGSRSWIMLGWEDGMVRASADDMSVMKEFDEMFYGDDTPRPEGHTANYSGTSTSTSSTELMINNGNLYSNNTSWGGTDPIFYGPMASNDGSEFYLAPYSLLAYGSNKVAYDQEGMRFFYNGSWAGTLMKINSTKQPLFDFDNVGKKMIYMAYGFGNTSAFMAYGVFKNPVDNGERYIYLMNLNTSASSSYATAGILDITNAPEAADAKIFAYGNRGPVIFYAGKNKIYQIDYSLDETSWPHTPDVNAVWDFGTDETITCMKFMKHPGVDLPERADDKYLFVATWNQSTSEGKVYVLQADVASGMLASEAMATYTGFGKIKDMCYKAK